MALIGTIFIVNLSLSGAMLIFAKDIQCWINPHYWTVGQVLDGTGQSPISLNQLIPSIESKTKQTVSRVDFPSQQRMAWQFHLLNGEIASVNPSTGELLLRYRFEESLYGFFHVWHRWLLLTTVQGERPLRELASYATLILIVNTLFGGYLWIKLKRRWRHLVPNHRSGSFLTRFRYHNLLGLIVFLPIILIGFSGLSFNWLWPKTFVEKVTLSNVSKVNFTANIPLLFDEQLNGYSDYQGALLKAKKILINAPIYRMTLPTRERNFYTIRMKTKTEHHAYSRVWLHPYNLKLLKVYNASKKNLATSIWHFRYNFHIGDFLHPSIKYLWFMMALTPVLFIYTGLSMYLIKRRKRLRTQSAFF